MRRFGDGKEASIETSIERPNNYPVEVSGWDARELFVEKTLFRSRPEIEAILVQAQKMQTCDTWNTEIPLLN
jgi:hypothetical protein